MIFLRQSTASQEIPLGRFVDSTDGNTEETALTIANTDITIWKTGATTLANKNSGGATHIANGEYYCVLDATDTDTIGPMKVAVHVAGALSVQVFCCVLDEAVYDALFGTAGWATAAELAKVPKSDGTVTFNATCSSDIKSGLATPANILGAAVPGAYGAGTLGKVVGDNLDATVSSRLATAGYTAPLDAAGVRGAVGLAAANLDTQLGDVPTVAEFEARTLLAADYFDPAADTVATVTSLTNPVTLANGAHGGAAATLSLKSVDVTNGDGGGTAVGIVANGAGGTGLLVSGTASDITADITGNLSGSIGSVDTGGIAAASFSAGAIDAAAIAADAIGASELAAGAVDEILNDALTDSVPADGALPTVRQSLYMIWQFLSERSVAGTTVTVRKADGTTALMTFTLDDGTNPTSITRAT